MRTIWTIGCVGIALLIAACHSDSESNASSQGNTSGDCALPSLGGPPQFRTAQAFGSRAVPDDATRDMLLAYARAISSRSGSSARRALKTHLDVAHPGGEIRTTQELDVVLRHVWAIEQENLDFRQQEDGFDLQGPLGPMYREYYINLGNRTIDAQALRAKPAWTWFGFSRCIDVKARISPASVRQFLGTTVLTPQRPNGGLISTKEDLFSSMLGHMSLDLGSSMKADVTQEVGNQLMTWLRSEGLADETMGCAGAYAANLNTVMMPGWTEQNRTYFDPGEGDFSSAQIRRFFGDVHFTVGGMSGDLPGLTQAQMIEYTDSLQAAQGTLLSTRYNLGISAEKGAVFQVANGSTVKVPDRGFRANISTAGAVNMPVFAQPFVDLVNPIDPGSTLAQTFAQKLALQFVVGLHYLTQKTTSEISDYVQRFAQVVRKLREANSGLIVHNQYVLAKAPSGDSDGAQKAERERQMYEALDNNGRPVFTSMDVNAQELAPLIRHLSRSTVFRARTGLPAAPELAAAGPGAEEGEPPITPATPIVASEHVDNILSGERIEVIFPLARWLFEALQLKRLNVHAYQYDLLLRRNASTDLLERSVDYLLYSTKVAAAKLRVDAGQISEPAQITNFYWYAPSQNISHVMNFWLNHRNAWAEGKTMSPTEVKQHAMNSYYNDESRGFGFALVPNTEYLILRGGLTSLGDVRSFASLRMELAGGARPSVPR